MSKDHHEPITLYVKDAATGTEYAYKITGKDDGSLRIVSPTGFLAIEPENASAITVHTRNPR